MQRKPTERQTKEKNQEKCGKCENSENLGTFGEFSEASAVSKVSEAPEPSEVLCKVPTDHNFHWKKRNSSKRLTDLNIFASGFLDRAR